MGTLGKAAGVAGAFVAAHPAVIETLVQTARSYVYTTAAPPLLAEALRASLAIIRGDAPRRAHLAALIARFRERIARAAVDARATRRRRSSRSSSGRTRRRVALADALWQRGFWVPAIRPPTVPEGTARLRITLSAAHSRGRRRCARRCARRSRPVSGGSRRAMTAASGCNASARTASAEAVRRAGLHVESAGHGPPIVLLHGWAMHSGLWGPLVPRLARRYRVHAVDLPGHGHSAALASFTLDAVRRRADRGVRGRGNRSRCSAGRSAAWSRCAGRCADRGASGASCSSHVAAVRRRRRLAARDVARDARPLRRRAARRVEAHGAALPRAADARQRARPRDARRAAERALRARRAVAEGARRRARASGGADLRAESARIAQPALVVVRRARHADAARRRPLARRAPAGCALRRASPAPRMRRSCRIPKPSARRWTHFSMRR